MPTPADTPLSVQQPIFAQTINISVQASKYRLVDSLYADLKLTYV
ncbi:hypothetical protein BH09BAC4_BH09BAC4_34230 [soil metagenome]